MRVSLRRPLAAVAAAGLAAAVLAAPAPPRELVLAGGALAVCSDLAPRSCANPPSGAARQPARFRIDAEGIARALDPALWSAAGAPSREAVEALLQRAQSVLRGTTPEAAALEDAMAAICLDAACADTDPRRPWSVMLDGERAALLAALEVPQRTADGARPAERAHPEASRVDGGVAVLRAFVAAAQARAPGRRPKVAVVTASGFDPMDAVDFYLDAFRDLGADAIWWPVDGAAAAARFERGDCGALPALRRERLRLPNREAVYPDLAAFQQAYCDSQPALLLQVQGVFFAGGDQWKHRQAFVLADGRANDWLRELQQAHGDGRVVVGGTSAGSAVQSASWMLGNGDVEAAVARAARVAAPPEPGCARGGRCGGVPEDALTLWPDGGLRLAEDAIVDTHFSERARELRLLMAMQAAGARWGYGADETSALHVRESPGRREIEALGASGGWVFRRDPAMRDEVEAWYLAPGARLVVERGLPPGRDGADAFGERVRLVVDAAAGRPGRVRRERPASAFEGGALRAMAARLAWRCGRTEALPAAPGTAELACAEGARGWVSAGGVAGVGPLRLRFVRAAPGAVETAG
jgi:cyanophycinase-like exopeptidase